MIRALRYDLTFTSLEKGRYRSCSLGDECRQRKVRISVILKKSSIFQLHIPEEDILRCCSLDACNEMLSGEVSGSRTLPNGGKQTGHLGYRGGNKIQLLGPWNVPQRLYISPPMSSL